MHNTGRNWCARWRLVSSFFGEKISNRIIARKYWLILRDLINRRHFKWFSGHIKSSIEGTHEILRAFVHDYAARVTSTLNSLNSKSPLIYMEGNNNLRLEFVFAIFGMLTYILVKCGKLKNNTRFIYAATATNVFSQFW